MKWVQFVLLFAIVVGSVGLAAAAETSSKEERLRTFTEMEQSQDEEGC